MTTYIQIFLEHCNIFMGNNEGLGKLYLIPIELGNVEVEQYQPQRTLELLGRLRYYVVENARTARRYLSRSVPGLDISSLTIYELDKHQGYSYPREKVMELLRQGEDVGVMSEAGCPGVADPGHRVVIDCHRAGMRVVPLVGPSSILLSLMASGFNGQYFTFYGYLPHDRTSRRQQLLECQRRALDKGETQIFIEAPYRNDQLIRELCDLLSPALYLSVAVDLTTSEEEITTLPLSLWSKHLKGGLSYHKRPAIFLLGRGDD